MAIAEIHSGICGFNTTVEAFMNQKRCNLLIKSECKAVQKLAEELKQVDPLQEISFHRSMPEAIRLGMHYCQHAACPVPAGIIKAVEVAAGLALPADVTVKISKSNKG